MPVYLSAVMITAVLVVGGQALSFAHAAQPAEDHWESRVVAAADSGGGGISTPLLVGGILLAFTVGLVAGESARRRGRNRRVENAVTDLEPAREPMAATPAPPAPLKPKAAAPAPPPPKPKASAPPRQILVTPPPARLAPAPPPPPPPKRPEPEAEPAPEERPEPAPKAEAPPKPAPKAGAARKKRREPARKAKARPRKRPEPAPAAEAPPEPQPEPEAPPEPQPEPAPEAEAPPEQRPEPVPEAEAPPKPRSRRAARSDVPRKKRPPKSPARPPEDRPAKRPPQERPAKRVERPPERRPAAPVARIARAPDAIPGPEIPAGAAGTPLGTPVPFDRSRPRAPAPPRRRTRPWPEEAATVWTCEIEWKPGYRKSFFRAMATPPGGRRARSLGESAGMKWGLMSDPEPPTRELVEAVRSLLTALESAGWQRIEPAGPWFSQRFLWRGNGEPGPVEPARRDDAIGA